MRIPDDVIRLKKRVFSDVHTALQKAGKRLESLFAITDLNEDLKLDVHELGSVFEKMKISLTDSELKNIFLSMDFDLSGEITFPEFAADFNRTVQSDTAVLIQEEKDRYESEVRKNQYSQVQDGGMIRNDIITQGAGLKQNQELHLQTKIAILETREKHLNRKLATAMSIVNHANQAQLEVQKASDKVDKELAQVTELYHKAREDILRLEEGLR